MIKKQIEYKKVCLLNQQFINIMSNELRMNHPHHGGGKRYDLQSTNYLITNYCKELDDYSGFIGTIKMSKHVFNDIKILPTDNPQLKFKNEI